jgi:ATP-dependent Clp protease ATP-binding subunit ClpA
MFERFGRHARVAVVLAQEEAKDLSAEVIGPEHLVAGIVQSASRELSGELAAVGMTVESVREQLGANASGASFESDADALQSIGIDLQRVRERINQRFGAGTFDDAVSDAGRRPRRGNLAFSKPAKEALKLALREAVAHHDSTIDSEHLLLGVLRGGDPVACALITAHVEKDVLRSNIIALLDRAA